MICVFFYKRPIYADVVYSGFVALPDLGLFPYYVLQCNKDNYCKNNDFCCINAICGCGFALCSFQ